MSSLNLENGVGLQGYFSGYWFALANQLYDSIVQEDVLFPELDFKVYRYLMHCIVERFMQDRRSIPTCERCDKGKREKEKVSD